MNRLFERFELRIVTPHFCSDFECKLPVTSRLFEIQDLIKEKHGGSVGKVKLCIDTYQESDILKDMTKMLKEVNIAQATYKIYYEFESFSHPLLTTTIKEDHEKVFKPPPEEELE